MDPEKIMDSLSKELNIVLKAMSKAKNANEKEVYSRIVKKFMRVLRSIFRSVERNDAL